MHSSLVLEYDSATPTLTSLDTNASNASYLILWITSTSKPICTSRNSSVLVSIATETRDGTSTLNTLGTSTVNTLGTSTPIIATTAPSSETASSSSYTTSTSTVPGAVKHHHHATTGTIVGATIGGVLGLVLALLALVCLIRCCRRRRRNNVEDRNLDISGMPHDGVVGFEHVKSRLQNQSMDASTRKYASPISAETKRQGDPNNLFAPVLAGHALHDIDDRMTGFALIPSNNDDIEVPQGATLSSDCAPSRVAFPQIATESPVSLQKTPAWEKAADPDEVVEQEWQLISFPSSRTGRPPVQVPETSQDPSFRDVLSANARKARADPKTDLGSENNLRRLIRLALYQPVIYCDDSSSMTRRDHLSSTRFDQLREIVKRITRVANILVPDDMGVHLRFINHPRVYDHLNTAQTENAMRLVYPTSGTPSGTVLETRILRPLVYNLLDNPRGPQLRRPLLICTITDGAPTDGDAFKKAILKCRRRIVAAGYAPKTVMFSISHIGQDRHAAQFIQSLRSDGEIKDVIYCTSDSIDGKFYELRDNERGLEVWLLELLTNGLN